MDTDRYLAWLNEGIDAGFCSMPVCTQHDMLPATDEEIDEWDAGHDPCLFGVRLWEPWDDNAGTKATDRTESERTARPTQNEPYGTVHDIRRNLPA